MPPHPAVADRLARLAPDQRAAATAAPGPVLCIAPAGSGKTTTLVARIAWLLDRGVPPERICALTFNRRAADELAGRLDDVLGALGLAAGAVRVRTFHALGREILLDAGGGTGRLSLVDRDAVLRRALPMADRAERRRLDTAISRLKLDLVVDPEAVAADPAAGPVGRAYVAYERALRAADALDFDDLVGLALRRLDEDAHLLERWRTACTHLLVDEAQDLDRSQLRLALQLAAPANRIFLVGDDDQSIYGWRLADVRRTLGLANVLPGLVRVDLETNYRCPAVVIERAVRLVERNRERFAKRVTPGPAAVGRLVLAPDPRDDLDRAGAVLDRLPPSGTAAVLARTNRELLPAVVAALARGLPFRAPALELPLDSPLVDAVLDAARVVAPDAPLLVRLERAWRSRERSPNGVDDDASADDDDTSTTADELRAAVLAWAAPFPSLGELRDAVAAARGRLRELQRDDARLTLATAHGTKGLEFDHVAVIGFDAGRFPSRRAVEEAADPERALEEERRLAYVAWTRARRSLTLVYDPDAPSPFLLEAFTADELGLGDRR